MRLRADGSVQSYNIPTAQNIHKRKDYAVYRCMVFATQFVDVDNNTQNSKNARVLYDVVVLGGFSTGQTISNCRLAADLGGNDNYHEVVLTPTSKKTSQVRLEDHDGDVVYVQFIQGDTAFPVIMGLDIGQTTFTEIGAKKEDGIREKRQFNGVKIETTKTGEHTFTRQGGTVEEGRFKPEEGDPQYTKEILDEELVTETFKSGLVKQTDGVNDRILRQFQNGLTISEDGTEDQVTIQTAAGAILTVNGPDGQITLTHGSTVLLVDGTTGKITLQGSMVDIGASVSDLAVLFSELVTAHNGHFHLAPQAPGGVLPTQPPSAPMPPNVGSLTVGLQA